MTAPSISKWFSKCLAAGLLMAAGTDRLLADEYYDMKDTSMYVDNTDHDLQFFSPVDFDFENLPIQQPNGYFFTFDKLNWATTGERTTIGSENTGPGTTGGGSLAPFREFLTGRFGDNFPDPEFLTPVITVAPNLSSGINSGPPRAEFAWGERYEFGVYHDSAKWSVGILDGPEANAGQSYGLETQDSIYGSVLVVFDDPQNLFRGFIDVIGPSGGAFAPDGLADDIDGDSQYGPDGYDLDDPGRAPDSIYLPDPRGDWDDLVVLPTSFQFLNARNSTKSDGIELMKSHRLDNRHRMVKNQNNVVEFGYGVRYLRLRDKYDVVGFGGTMGQSFWDTRIDNNLVGPQISLKWMHQKNRFRLDWSGRFMFAYNIMNMEQDAALGQDLVPGQYNRSWYMGPTVSSHGQQDNDFSPTAEMRVNGSYQISRAIALNLGYTATFVDNIRRAAQQVKYELPNMGFREGAGTQEIFINGVNFGFDVVY
jgi:hypothetical protein